MKLSFLVIPVCVISQVSSSDYQVGVGIADSTGPAAEISMMGYAKEGQYTKGIHLRQFSRAFIFVNGLERVVFVSVDSIMMGQLVKKEVIRKLRKEFGEIYNFKNVVLSNTHTHSGPGGFVQYLLLGISTLGWNQQTYYALCTGIFKSIKRAHENIQAAQIYYTEAELNDASINRSPAAYLMNPPEERSRYRHNRDTMMRQINIISANKESRPLGLINWFAVHPTSMNNTNKLISSDNKGVASLTVEKAINTNRLVGKGPFVAAFASSNLGDVSPNIMGPMCIDSGKKCNSISSACGGRVQNCIASGPGEDMFESCRIIGERQALKALKMLQDVSKYKEIHGSIRSINQWIDMTNQTVKSSNGSIIGKTCKPALGYSFAAGTSDGPGMFDFTQGMQKYDIFWKTLRSLIKGPTEEQNVCHLPKPILLDTGEMTFPYQWHPSIVDTQMLKIGNILIAAVPGEFTTMAGRRMENSILKATNDEDNFDFKVIIAGLSNVYTHYVTTQEEYQLQRYEGASNIYGPLSLQVYQNQYAFLTKTMLKNESIYEGIQPPNLMKKQFSLIPGVTFDSSPLGFKFGDCLLQPPEYVYPGETISVRFVAGHPRNNLMLEKSFLNIEIFDVINEDWKVLYVDADWCTKFEWIRTNAILGQSEAEIVWEVPTDVKLGKYRILHFGYHKTLLDQKIHPYSGISQQFEVIGADENSRMVRKKPERRSTGFFTQVSKIIGKVLF